MDQPLDGCSASRRVAVAGVTAVVAGVAWRASIDLDPGSLWLDDAWMVALAQSGSWSELSASPSSAPIGFKLLVAAALALGGDLEVSAQSVAFGFGLGAVSLVGWLAFRLSSNAVVAICAAAWVGLDATFLVQMARVKPYTLDAFVVAAQGLAFCALVESYSRKRVWCFVGVVIAGLAFSSLSLFPALAASAVGSVLLWRRGVRDMHALAAGILVLSAIAEAGSLAASAVGADELRGYWNRHYLPSHDLTRFFDGVVRWLGSWTDRLMHDSTPHPSRFPLPGAFAVALLLAGTLEMWLSKRHAELAVGGVLWAGVAVASSIGLLPLGIPRVEIFLLPFASVLIASSAGLAARVPGRRAARVASLLLPVFAAVQLPSDRLPGYPLQQARRVVDALALEYREGDGIWSNILGTFALAVYGPWEVDFASNDQLGIPHALPRVTSFALLDGPDRGARDSPPDTDRIFVFVCYDDSQVTEEVIHLLRSAEYRLQGFVPAARCWLGRFDR